MGLEVSSGVTDPTVHTDWYSASVVRNECNVMQCYAMLCNVMQSYAMLCNWLVSKTYTRDGFGASLNAIVAHRYAIDILDDLALNIIQLQDMVILWCKNQ